jgi:hypothetical protein
VLYQINHQKIADALQFPTEDIVDIVIDTDAYNEVDDQFAIAWALRSPERINVEAIYAAPFCSLAITKVMPPPPPGHACPVMTAESLGPSAHFAATPAEGMEKSYQEIQHLFELLNIPSDGKIFRGSTTYIENNNGNPIESEAARDLVNRAMNRHNGKRLYVLAIGAITNVVSALMLEPAIADKITVVWLGGQPPYFKNGIEFNLMQDIPASQYLLDCGVPLVLIPCIGVASHLTLTLPELDSLLIGRSVIGTYLGQIVREAVNPSPEAIAMGDLFGYECGMNDIPMEVRRKYTTKASAWSRIVWDISVVGYIMSPNWTTSSLQPAPVLNDDMTWGHDPSRHPVRLCCYVKRDSMFGDLFMKLENRDK